MTTAPPIPCPTCRYDLQGLVTDRGATCPECSAFAPLESLSDHAHRHRVTTRRLYLLLLLTPVAWLAPILIGLVDYKLNGGRPRSDAWLMGFLAALCWSTAIEYRIFIHGRGDGRGPGRVLSLCIALFVAVPITILSVCIGAILVAIPLKLLIQP